MKKNKLLTVSSAFIFMFSSCPLALAKTTNGNKHNNQVVRTAPVLNLATNVNTGTMNNKIELTINYQENGKTIKSVVKECNNDDSIDVMPDLPTGYTTQNGWNIDNQPISVNNGKATVAVPVEKLANDTSNTNTNDSNNTFTATITYTYNGKTVKTANETCQTGSTIDIVKNLPKGYQVSTNYKGEDNISINNGKASLTVPVEPISSTNSNDNTLTAIINYQSNGKTINSITLHNVSKDSPVNVSNDLPKGYKIDSSYNPNENTPVINGVVTFNVPVVADNDSTTSPIQSDKSSENSNKENTSSTTINNETSSATGSSQENTNNDTITSNTTSSSQEDNTNNDTITSNAKDDSKTSVNNTSSNSNEKVNKTLNYKSSNNSSLSAEDNVSANTQNISSDSHSEEKSSSANDDSKKLVVSSVNTNSQKGLTATTNNDNKNTPVKDLTGDVPTKKINYVDKNGTSLKTVETPDGVANKDIVEKNAPSNNTTGAKYTYDKNGNLKVTLPQTGENNQTTILLRVLGTITAIIATLGGIYMRNKKRSKNG